VLGRTSDTNDRDLAIGKKPKRTVTGLGI